MTNTGKNVKMLCKIVKEKKVKVNKNINYEYLIGILWNMGHKCAREMMLKIANMEDVIQVKILDLKGNYDQFVLDCYKGDDEAYQDGYIYEKIKDMNIDKKQIVVFVFKVDNPTYIKSEDGKIQCVEARKVKQRIRNEYANKIDNYFFDNLIHISDNVEESKKTLETVNKYKKFTIGNYIRKGYQPIIENTNINRKNTYVSLLKELRDEE